MKVTIFGTGYVGLVAGACLADAGHNVICVDVDEARVAALSRGDVLIHEPGLASLISRSLGADCLQFTTAAERGVHHGDVIFIAVGTPSKEDGSADLQDVMNVANTIGMSMTTDKVVAVKSTVPVGSCDQVKAEISRRLAERDLGISFDVISNPEFLKEGAAISDFQKPDRIVVGTDSESARSTFSELYAPFNRNHQKLIFMDVRSAELTKYVANAMLATKISFMNEMANLASKLGADIEDVRQGIGSDSRIGYQFIYSGCGYGGPCFPKDIRALTSTASQVGLNARLLKSVEEINNDQKTVLFEKLQRYFDGSLEGRTVAVWGLAFKPNTNDMRDAPSRLLMEALWQAGSKVRAYDPEAMEETRRIYPDEPLLTLAASKEDALSGADALVICTEWRHFQAPDFELLKERMHQPVIFDGRNIYDPQVLKDKGFYYAAIGRGEI